MKSRYAASTAAKSLQSCPTLCDPIDGSPPGFPVPGILQKSRHRGHFFFFFCFTESRSLSYRMASLSFANAVA